MQKKVNRPFVEKMQVSANWPLGSGPPQTYNNYRDIIHGKNIQVTAFFNLLFQKFLKTECREFQRNLLIKTYKLYKFIEFSM